MTTAGGLAHFQDAFARSLLAPETRENPAFLVYRNTVLKGCVDALQANFPAVTRLVGEEWFRAAAVDYARRFPPQAPMLVEYGAGFPDFLAHFEPAAQLSYLPAVARLDRFWVESHVAADEAPLRAQDLAGLAQDRLGGITLRPHAAARWAWFALPAYSIWSRNRSTAPVAVDEPEVVWRSEGALLVRPGDAVEWLKLDAAACAFMDACAARKPLAEAAEAVPASELPGLLTRLLAVGAFTIMEPQ